MKKELDGDLVRSFWSYMQGKYRAKVVKKSASRMMRVIGWFLNLIGVLDKKRFMERYTTTIRDTVYTSQKIGEGSQQTLRNQIALAAHEMGVHVGEQYRKERAKFLFRYLRRSKRAVYEAKAYRVNMELYHWYTGKILDPMVLASKLYDYGCRDRDVGVAASILSHTATMLRRGGVAYSPTTKVAIAWLSERVATDPTVEVQLRMRDPLMVRKYRMSKYI